ncbi:hypothetical protein [Nonomuraea typhae]|uniref:hypothetical protein n=1 Tax=Nonomuraea typhae TaxID=2603600 RepID=UPI0012FC3FE3|nr:hypothetical protein [Nonomuraea typhae]
MTSVVPALHSVDPHVADVDTLRHEDIPRAAGNQEHITRLAESGAGFPPILLHRATVRVIDGIHRPPPARERQAVARIARRRAGNATTSARRPEQRESRPDNPLRLRRG